MRKKVDPMPGRIALAHALIDLPWLVHVMFARLEGLYSAFKKGYRTRLVKFSKTAIAICFNLLQVCPSVSSFVFTVFFILSFNSLSGYVCV